jgi:hypothetical protein
MSLTRLGVSILAASLIAVANSTNLQNIGLVKTIQHSITPEFGNAIALDSSGNMFSGGSTLLGPKGLAPNIQAFSPTGTELWGSSFSNPTASDGQILYMVRDLAGNTYVTGTQIGQGADFDWFTAKFTSSGVITWFHTLSGANRGADTPCGIAVDSTGNVYVAGNVDQGLGLSTKIVAVKYGPTGTVVWQNNSVGSAAGGVANAMCLAPSGRLHIGGTDPANGDFCDMAVDKTGASLPVKEIATAGSATAIVSDANSNVAAAGYVYAGSGLNAAVLYIPSGNGAVWSKTFAVSGLLANNALARIDSSGNVVMAATETAGVVPKQSDIFQYDATGVLKWHKTFSGLNVSTPTVNPTGLVVDSFGNVYESGYSFYNSSYPEAAYVVKYSSTGTQMFVGYHGVLGGVEEPMSLAIDANSDLYTSGYVNASPGGFQTIIQHWSQAPVANNDSYTMTHGHVLSVSIPGVLLNDTFTHLATVSLHSGPTHGTVSLAADGSFNYTPTSTYVGTDSFQYTATKAAGGGISNVATVTITVG